MDFFVDPVAAGVLDVVLNGGPAGEGVAADESGGDEEPAAVADHGDGLTGAIGFLDEAPGFGDGTEGVGVERASG